MTFSIAARCHARHARRRHFQQGALCSGLVPYCRAGVGAIASQSFVNPYLGIDGLVLLEQASPLNERSSAWSRMTRDATCAAGDRRKDGRAAAYTGTRCIPGQATSWAQVTLPRQHPRRRRRRGGHGARIPEQHKRRIARAADSRLEAGQEQAATPGRQSAGMTVVNEEEYPWIDVRVDDHEDPVPELRRIYEIYKRRSAVSEHDGTTRRFHSALGCRRPHTRRNRTTTEEESVAKET